MKTFYMSAVILTFLSSCSKTSVIDNIFFDCKTSTSTNMKNDSTGFESPLVCKLSGIEQIKRYLELKEGLFKDISEIKEMRDGYELIFAKDIQFSLKIIEFINFERECCPAFTFTMNFEPNAGPIHLQIHGSNEVKELLKIYLQEYLSK